MEDIAWPCRVSEGKHRAWPGLCFCCRHIYSAHSRQCQFSLLFIVTAAMHARRPRCLYSPPTFVCLLTDFGGLMVSSPPLARRKEKTRTPHSCCPQPCVCSVSLWLLAANSLSRQRLGRVLEKVEICICNRRFYYARLSSLGPRINRRTRPIYGSIDDSSPARAWRGRALKRFYCHNQ